MMKEVEARQAELLLEKKKMQKELKKSRKSEGLNKDKVGETEEHLARLTMLVSN